MQLNSCRAVLLERREGDLIIESNSKEAAGLTEGWLQAAYVRGQKSGVSIGAVGGGKRDNDGPFCCGNAGGELRDSVNERNDVGEEVRCSRVRVVRH